MVEEDWKGYRGRLSVRGNSKLTYELRCSESAPVVILDAFVCGQFIWMLIQNTIEMEVGDEDR